MVLTAKAAVSDLPEKDGEGGGGGGMPGGGMPGGMPGMM